MGYAVKLSRFNTTLVQQAIAEWNAPKHLCAICNKLFVK